MAGIRLCGVIALVASLGCATVERGVIRTYPGLPDCRSVPGYLADFDSWTGIEEPALTMDCLVPNQQMPIHHRTTVGNSLRDAVDACH